MIYLTPLTKSTSILLIGEDFLLYAAPDPNHPFFAALAGLCTEGVPSQAVHRWTILSEIAFYQQK